MRLAAQTPSQHRCADEKRRPARGVLLAECLVYMGLLLVIMTLALQCFHQMLDHSKRLHRCANEILNALDVGERWRADVRAARQPPRLEQLGAETVLRLPGAQGEVLYAFREGAVWRKDTARARSDWVRVLERVHSSRMVADPRGHVTAWRWELELASGPKSRVKPLFTFQAVAGREAAL